VSTLLTARVESIRYEAREVVTVELVPAEEGGRFPGFEAGAHIDLHLPNGLVRSYSLCNPSQDGGPYRIGVAHDRNSRGGSRFVHRELRVGTIVSLSIPRNNFRLVEDAPLSVLVAGGIGVTPLYAMAQRLHALGRPFSMHCCGRTNADMPFRPQLGELAGPHVAWHFDDEAGGPPDLRARLAGLPRETHLYCCGPAPMLAAFEAACAELGYANVHIERFSADVAPAAPNAAGYVVELARSGKALRVEPGESLLSVVRSAGIAVDFSCEEGICGACETRVLAGDVVHRDCILSEAERSTGRSMMLCVSGCASERLVLDL
jgi:ferredoxin-NADP reductase